MNNPSALIATLFALLIIGTGCSSTPVQVDVDDIAGVYVLDGGASLRITKGKSVNEYRISGEDSENYLWTSVGFFNPDCLCINGVFQYGSHKDVYADAVGVHRFTFLNNYRKVVKEGGWGELTEFPRQTYIRQ